MDYIKINFKMIITRQVNDGDLLIKKYNAFMMILKFNLPVINETQEIKNQAKFFKLYLFT